MANKLLTLLFVLIAGFASAATVTAERIQGSAVITPDGKSGLVKLTIELEVKEPGRFFLCGGDPVLEGTPIISGERDGWFRRAPEAKLDVAQDALWLDVKRPGRFSIQLPLRLPVRTDGAERILEHPTLMALSGSFSADGPAKLTDWQLADALKTGERLWAWNGGRIRLSWREAAAGATGELISADASTLLAVTPGMLRSTGFWVFRVGRGKLRTLSFLVPPEWNIASVRQLPAEASNQKEQPVRWSFDRAARLLTIQTASEIVAACRLEIVAERPLGTLPVKFELRPLVAQNAMPGEFQLAITAAPELRLERLAGTGLIQTEGTPQLLTQAKTLLPHGKAPVCYSVLRDFHAEFEVTPIRPSFTEESRTKLHLRDGGIQARFDAKLEIRDAALPELELEYDGALQFSRIVSDKIRPQDYTILPGDGARKILRLKLHDGTPGTVEFSAWFEADRKNDAELALRSFRLKDARNTRGTLILTADKGLNLANGKFENITPMHAGMLKANEPGLLRAFLYRSEPWSLRGAVELEERHISGEVFSLVSAGEGSAYGFTLFTVHLSGAPVEKLLFRVSDRYENLEFRGVPLAGAKRIGEADKSGFRLWELTFKEKQSGPLMLLGSYEISRGEGKTLPAGAMSCVGARPESVYIAVSGRRGMSAKLAGAFPEDKSLRRIDHEDLPAEYANMIGNTLLDTYRSDRPDAWGTVELTAFDRAENRPLLIRTLTVRHRIDSNGSAMTHAELSVNNASAQFLPVKLPAQSRLWQLKVNGKPERATIRDGKLLIPLRRPERITDIIPIELVYAREVTPPAKAQSLKLEQPQFDAPLLRRTTTVELPAAVDIRATVPAQPEQSRGIKPGLAGLPGTRPERILVPFFFLICFSGAALLAARGAARGNRVLKNLGIAGFIAGLLFYVLAGLLLPILPGAPATAPTRSITFEEEALLRTAPQEIELHFADLTQGDGTTALGYGVAALLFAVIGMVGIRRRSTLLQSAGFGLCFASLCGAAAQYLPGQAVLTLALFAGAPVVFPILLGIAAWRHWRKASALLLLCVGAWTLGAVEVREYHYTLTPQGENIRLQARLQLEMKTGETLPIAPKAVQLKQFELPPELTLIRGKDGDFVLRAGEEFTGTAELEAILPGKAQDGATTFQLTLPPSLRGSVRATLPAGFTLQFPQALEAEGEYRFPMRGGQFTGKLERRAGDVLELHGMLDSLLMFRRDVTELQLNAQINIPQGETDSITLELPDNMQIRKVSGRAINSWKSDGGKLRIFFNTPQENGVLLNLELFRAREKLPDTFEFQAPRLAGATQEMNFVTVIAAPEIRLTPGKAKEFSMLSADGKRWSSGNGGRIPFRLDEEQPELQVAEQTELRYEDGRTVLNAQLTLQVTRGGIFQTRLRLPNGFEVLKLTGPDLADWVEKERVVALEFKKRITGQTRLTIELAHLTDSRSAEVELPKLEVEGAAKLTGTLAISAERGTALSVLSRNGVSPTGTAAAGNNALYFQLLNPEWRLKLRFDAAPVWLQAETFQKVRMRVSSTECEAIVNLKIENNSIKTLLVELPATAQLPEFTGRRLQKAVPLGNNRWKLEFDGRLEKQYRLTVNYKLRGGEKNTVTVEALKFPEAASQSGYVAIRTADSLEFRAPELTGEATQLNARALPLEWQGDAADAPVAALRTVGTAWKAELSANSNPNAGLCKLTVNQLNLKTRLEGNGVQLNRAELQFSNNGDSFLTFTLPQEAQFWGARIGGAPVETVRDGQGAYLVPVENGEKQQMELTWSTFGAEPKAGQTGKLTGLKIGAPLNNVIWQVVEPKGFDLNYLGGSVEERQEMLQLIAESSSYGRGSEELVKSGRALSRSGRIRDANKLMQSAIDQAADVAKRNDLQGELLIQNRQYNSLNLQNRQQTLTRNNAEMATQTKATKPMPGLAEVADKIFEQQQAIYAAPQIYELPVETQKGESRQFERALETRQNAPLELEYELKTGYRAPRTGNAWLVFAMLAGMGVLGAYALRRK